MRKWVHVMMGTEKREVH